MTEQTANRIYDVLATLLGANEDMRQSFVIQNTASLCREWRFIGTLGFGGKFRNTDGRYFVNCYPEDVTPERTAAIEMANGLLTKIKAALCDMEECSQPVGAEDWALCQRHQEIDDGPEMTTLGWAAQRERAKQEAAASWRLPEAGRLTKGGTK